MLLREKKMRYVWIRRCGPKSVQQQWTAMADSFLFKSFDLTGTY
jgi:hypothetical protein